MADEFIDFYEALNLPLEADRKQIRARINEVYGEAQRNLDHRNFQTRVKHQEMFEVVLPRARYILLDEGRRDEYDQLVRAFRGASALSSAPSDLSSKPDKPASSTELSTTEGQSPVFGEGDASRFRLAEETAVAPSGKAPVVSGLPTSSSTPEEMARQRDELWQKWKSGLEAAIARDENSPVVPRPSPLRPTPAAPSSPVPSPVEPLTDAAASTPPVNTVASSVPPRPTASAPANAPINLLRPATPSTPAAPTSPAPAPAPRPTRAPAQPIAFDFSAENAGKRGDSAPVPGAEELVEAAKQRLSPEELARQRDEKKREAMVEILTGVGMKANLLGSLGAGLPLAALLFGAMRHFYPPDDVALLSLPPQLAWFLGLLVVAGASYAAAHFLSKHQRRQKAIELAPLSLEEILRLVGRDY